jgi:succinate dehydrogenase/fumarate reductase cytochrome b subunit
VENFSQMPLLKILQAISGLTFASFSTVHLGGHLLSNFSFRWSDQALFANRELFRSPIVELGLIGSSLVIHVFTSAWLFFIRPTQRESSIAIVRQRQQEIQLHRYSGYILAGLMCTHITYTRILPFVVLDDPEVLDLTFVTHSFSSLIMYPYYIILGTTGMYHTLYGLVQSIQVLKLSRFQLKPGRWLFWSKVFTGVIISTVLALSGLYERVPLPLHDIYEKLTLWSLLGMK